MSSELKLSDETTFDLRFAKSGKAVVVGFQDSDLEKLLRTAPTEKVILDSREQTYQEAKERIGPIAAYIPNPADYLKVCNTL